jgi:hypothetical protein
MLPIPLGGMNEECVHFLKLCFVLLGIDSSVMWNTTSESSISHIQLLSPAMDVSLFQAKLSTNLHLL